MASEPAQDLLRLKDVQGSARMGEGTMSDGATADGREPEARERRRAAKLKPERAVDGSRSDRTAILHLGMHKTGSTAIQWAFANYADERIEYLDLGSQPNHSHVLSQAFDAHARPRSFDSPDSQGRRQERRDARRMIEDALHATSRSVLLSGEHLWSFRDGDSHRKCARFLRRHVGRIEALAYIRSPVSFAQSAFQERVRRKLGAFSLRTLLPRYREPAERWTEALDGAEPTFALFHPSALRDGDVVHDIAGRLGLDIARARRDRRHANTSLSAEATAVLFLLRRTQGAAPYRGSGQRVNAQVVGLLRGFGSSRFAFAPEATAPILVERAVDIAWMEKRLGQPFPPDSPPEHAVIFGSEEDILAYARRLGPGLADFLASKGVPVAAADRSTEALLGALCDWCEAKLATSKAKG